MKQSIDNRYRYCTNCGRRILPAYNYCPQCGHEVYTSRMMETEQQIQEHKSSESCIIPSKEKTGNKHSSTQSNTYESRFDAFFAELQQMLDLNDRKQIKDNNDNSSFVFGTGDSWTNKSEFLKEVLSLKLEKQRYYYFYTLENWGARYPICGPSYHDSIISTDTAYQFSIEKKEVFFYQDYVFFDFTLIDKNISKRTYKSPVLVYFSIVEPGGALESFTEKITFGDDGIFHLHACITNDKCEHKVSIVGLSIIRIFENPEKLLELSLLVEESANVIKEFVDKQKTEHSVHTSLNQGNNSVVIPINCSYSKKYFAKLFLLKECSIINQVISRYGVFQYQIPISADNEELILLTCGEHFCKESYDDPQQEYGETLISDDLQYLLPYSRILRFVSLSKILQQRHIIVCKESMQHLDEAITLLRQWINDNTAYYYNQYIKNGYLGIQWRSEYKLYRFFKFFFNDAVFQYRTEWLGEQSYDIYIPSLNVAVEYQGKQHYDVVPYFGGLEKYYENQRRDERKRQLSKEQGISLYEWKYTNAVNFTSVKTFIKDELHIGYTNKQIEILLSKDIPFQVEQLLEMLPSRDEQVSTVKKQQVFWYCQYDNDGIFIEKYQSLNDAASAAKTSKQQIENAIRGFALTAGGYQWIKIAENADVPDSIGAVQVQKSNVPISVYQCTETGEVIHEYASIMQAAKETGIDKKSIRYAVNGKQKSAGGYVWIKKTAEI